MPRHIKQWFFIGLLIGLTLFLIGSEPIGRPVSASVPLGIKIETAMNTTCSQGCARKWCKRAKCGDNGDKSCKAGSCRGCWKKAEREPS